MEFCPHCMRPASGAVCQSCGGRMDWSAQPGQLPLGTLLRGSEGHTYQIGAARGQGGFGITYAAMDLNTANRVAIKEYYPTYCAMRTQFNKVLAMTGQDSKYSSGMKSFLEEAMMLSAVGALPSVVTVHDYFEANGTAYLVMEFVDGVPLHEIVRTKGRMSADELLPKLSSLMKDLDILHRAGIIHRDISPDNLILMPDGNLKLLDFGSARSMQNDKAMTVLLKAGFSPVEQQRSTGQGPWTDVYALAATIYYCLTGEIPMSALDRLEGDTLQKPSSMGVLLSAEQEKALLWGLTVQPKARPQSMEEFSQKLFSTAHRPLIRIGGDRIISARRVNNSGTDEKTTDTNHQTVENDPSDHPEPVIKNEPAPQTDPDKTEEKTDDGKIPVTPERGPEETICVTEKVFNENQTINVAPPVVPAPAPVKKGLNKWVIIGAAAAAVLALVLIIAVAMNGGTRGTTSDGFEYKLVSEDHAVITGYTGTNGEVVVPNRIEGLPVRYLEDDVFDGCGMSAVTVNLDVIPQGDPFEGCNALRLFIFEAGAGGYDNCKAYQFSDLSGLRCILFPTEEAQNQSGVSGLDNVVLAHVGQSTDFGAIRFITVLGDVVYALTDTQSAVVLQMPADLDGDTLPTSISNYQVRLPDGRIPGQKYYRTGQTEDGYKYAISEDRTECIITGYTGSETDIVMPDEIDGIAINVIGEGAFSGHDELEAVAFPYYLERIEKLAFQNCSGLRDIYFYSDCTAASDAFSGCSELRCGVYYNGGSLSGAAVPSHYVTYSAEMETGVGPLAMVIVTDDNVIYGYTSNDHMLVMDIPDNAKTITLEEEIQAVPVEWIYEGALDGVSSDTVIYLPTEVLFPQPLWDRADWEFLDASSQFTLAECWYWNCKLITYINEIRGNTSMQMDPALTRAAMIRAEELAQSNEFTRPDGSKWGTVLTENDIEWTNAKLWKTTFNSYASDELLNELTEMAEVFAAPDPDLDNRYYDAVGLGLYYKNSVYYLAAHAIVVD